ncbi:MAG TPA: transporter substrate-binding domain-containing protein [Candidatus Tetragenococcus pullicola]|nr:transporter substrate-binding domain-containing protein [Candidatus Tetragenococcus pullicola]
MKKILNTLIVGVALITLAACGGTNETATSGTASKTGNQLEAIKEKGEIVVGTSADFAPFEFHAMIDGKDTVVGADIDMMNEIGKELGVNVKVTDMDFDAILAALEQGQVDVAVAGISATEERKQSFDFSENYFVPEQKILVKKDSVAELNSVDSLDGKKVGAQKGSIQETVVKDQLTDSQLVSLPKVPNLIVELQQGSIDALVLESAVADSYAAQNDDIVVADVELESSDDDAYAIVLPKGSTELQEVLNEQIKAMQENGQLDEFLQKNTDLANENASK